MGPHSHQWSRGFVVLLCAAVVAGGAGAGAAAKRGTPPDAEAGAPAASLRLMGTDATTVLANLDREAVLDEYYDTFVRAVTTPVGWTGSVARCEPGAPSPAAMAAGLDIYNYLRGLTQLPPGRFDPGYSAKAQAAALMMEAEDALSHFPDKTWACYSAAGAHGAAKSNLYLATDVPGDPEDSLGALAEYMKDEGDELYGHRRWTLNPLADRVGFGQTRLGNALYVLGEQRYGAPVPLWLPWPAAGYFPNELEPAGRWTLSSADPAMDFSRVRVSITGPDGALLPAVIKTTESGFGPETVAIEISRGTPGYLIYDDLTYRIVVSGIRRSGTAIAPVAYETTLVGYRPLRPTSTDLTIVGDQVPGGTLRLSGPPRFEEPVLGELRYQWYADGVAIEGATREEYWVRQADVGEGGPGRDISVDVTARGRHHGYGTLHVGTALSGALTPTGTARLTGAAHPYRMLSVADDDVTSRMADYTYRWFRDGAVIAGAVWPSRQTTVEDLGHRLSVEVTASHLGFADLIRTTESVAITPDVFLVGPPPLVRGRAKVGKALKATTGLTAPSPRRVGYQWLRNGGVIAGATSATYRATAKDRGRSLSVRVTVAKPGYRDKSRTSAAVRVR